MRVFVLIVCLLVCLQAAVIASDERDVSGGVQKCYLSSVPQTTAMGKVLLKYDPAESFFPLGLWATSVPDLKPLHEAGFNTIAVAGMDARALEEPKGRIELVRKLAASRIQLIPAYVPGADALRALVNERSILAYLAIDEPNRFVYSKDDPIEPAYQQILVQRRRVRSIDPNRGVYINLVARHWLVADPLEVAWWYVFNETGYITSTDCYEIYDEKSNMKDVARSVADQVLINQDRAPVWFIAPGHKDKRVPPHPDNAFPTPRQLRSAIYTAVTHGATGIMIFKLNEASWMLHPGIGPDTSPNGYTAAGRKLADEQGMVVTEQDAALSRELWKTASLINTELTSLKKVVLSPTSPVDYRIFVSGPKTEVDLPIRTLLKKVDGKFYLFAVNIESAEYKTRFELPAELKGVRDLSVMYGSSRGTASASGVSISDTFEPLGVRVYRFAAE